MRKLNIKGINKDDIKRLSKSIKENIFIQLFIYFVITVFFVFLMENLGMKSVYVNYINLFLAGTVIFIFVMFIFKQIYSKRIMLYLFSAAVIINRFYDKEEITKQFGISFAVFWVIVGVIMIVILLLPECIEMLSNSVKPLAKENKQRKNLSTEPKITKTDTSDAKNEEKHGVQLKSETGSKSIWRSIGKIFLIIIVTIIMIVMPCVLYDLFLGETFPLLQPGKNSNSDKILASIGLYILLIFIVASYAIILIKIVWLIIDVIMKKRTTAEATFYAIILLILVVYMYKDDLDFSQDSLLNMITKGDFFSLPLFLVIMIPVMNFLIESLLGILKRNNGVKIKVENLLSDTVSNIIVSMLQLVKFVTADFLSALTALTTAQADEDLEKSENEGEKQSDENGNKDKE